MIVIHGRASIRGCLGGGVFKRWCDHHRDAAGRVPCEKSATLQTRGRSPLKATAMILTWLSPTALGPLDWPQWSNLAAVRRALDIEIAATVDKFFGA